ncbi:hypothetical protein OH693_08175 [Escherichia coli]|nr:hypothetical protein [Escherichia coli]
MPPKLVFSRAASTATDELVLGENLLTLDFEEDFRDRFSEYTVKGMPAQMVLRVMILMRKVSSPGKGPPRTVM